MKKRFLFLCVISWMVACSAFSQNYISGTVSLHGDNTASGTTIVAPGASLVMNKNKLYAQAGFINQGDSTAISADKATLVLSGTGSQGISGRFNISSLQISNSSGVSISSIVSPTMVTILDSVNFGNINNTVFNAGDSLMTLRSNDLNTARIADLTNKTANSGNTVTGKIVVERYMRSRRAWHLLCPPTTADSVNDQTIQAAWQEGARAPRGQVVDPHPGYGTVITRPGSNPVSATGYDDGIAEAANYSMRMFTSNGLFTQPANTDLTHFSPKAAYFLFVRGDRSVSPVLQSGSNSTPSTITTLRSKGALHNGDVINTVTSANGSFAGVANPYACTVDFSQMGLSGITNGFYTWDPSISSYGGWVYIDGDDNYEATPSAPNGSYLDAATNPLIQSGQAIVVKPIGSTGTVTFTEKNKNITSRSTVFRQVAKPVLNISLFSKDSSHIFLDGTATVFDASFSSSALPDEDIVKPANLNENLSFYATGQYLMKGKNPLPSQGDTLPLRLWRTSAKSYVFTISMKNMTGTPQAYLLDRFTNSNTPIQADGETNYEFAIAGNDSSKSISRFAVVFGAGALPVTLTQVKAEWNGTAVNVHWNVQNETGVVSYEVESSTDGTSFSKAATVAVHSGSASAGSYDYADRQPAGGDNFYRIKIIHQDGSYTYSGIAVASVPVGKMLIAVRPNPVQNRTIKLWFENAEAGIYQVQVYSTDGKPVLSKKITHPGGTTTYPLAAGMLAQGMYHAVIKSHEGRMIADVPVIIE